MWAAIIPAAMSMIGTMMQSNSAQDTAESQNAINEKTIELQRDRFDYQKQRDKELQALSLSPITDAAGNKQGYSPERGYYTENSPNTQRNLTAEEDEIYRRLVYDPARTRRGQIANEDRRGREGQVADEYLRQLLEKSPYSRQGLESDLMQAGVHGIKEGYRDVAGAASKQALRSGSSAGPILAALAKREGSDISGAMLNARAQAPELYEKLQAAHTGRLGGLYNTFASRASNVSDAPFAPTGINEQAAAGLAGMSRGGITAGAYGANAVNGASLGSQIQLAPNAPSPLGRIGTIAGQLLDQPDIRDGFGSLFSKRQVGNASSSTPASPGGYQGTGGSSTYGGETYLYPY